MGVFHKAFSLGLGMAAALFLPAAQADDLPAGAGHDIVAAACSQCHAVSVVTSQRKTAAQWTATVRQMIRNGASVPEDRFDAVVSYLAKNFADNRAPGAKQDSGYADYNSTVPGKPVQNRPPEKPSEQPAFAGQTRAPYKASAPYKVTILTDKLHSPWALAFLPGGQMLITEKRPAAMRLLGSDGTLSAPLKGLAVVSRTPDFGLLDVALDKDFAANRRLFFTFFEVVKGTEGKPTNSNTYIASATLAPAGDALRDVKVIFRTAPAIPSNRLGLKTGGRIAVAEDGTLFVTIGDRSDVTPWDVAQRLDTDLGKIIHINTDGTPARDNPFIGQPGVLPEIWSYGNRSEEGLAFRPGTDQLWEDEHGPRGGDELNLIRKGRNYGWPVIAYGIDYDGKPITGGIASKPGMEQPVYFWDPVIAPSGLAFYRGDLFPQWKNSVFVGGLRGLLLTRLELSGDKVIAEEPMLTGLYAPVRDVRVGPDGAVYVLTDKDSLLKLTPKAGAGGK